jgi:hypothetical protein
MAILSLPIAHGDSIYGKSILGVRWPCWVRDPERSGLHDIARAGSCRPEPATPFRNRLIGIGKLTDAET